jgi:membrane protease YdiL (CAAX protease family)
MTWDGGRAILFFIFAALASIFIGIILQESLGFYISVLASELLVFLVIPFGLSRLFDTGWWEWMRQPRLTMPFWLWAITAVVSFAVVQSNLPVLFDRLYPIPRLEFEFLRQYLTADNPVDWLIVFVVGALVPSFCEEITFRGLIQTGLRRSYGARHAVVWTGFLFALLHLNPWNFLGLWFFGVFLGYLTERTGSIRPAIILHLLNNTFALVVFSVQDEDMWTNPPEFIPWRYTIIAGAVLVYALVRLHRSGEPPVDAPSASPGLPNQTDDYSGLPR